jgi:transcriptional regulator with XRE-family HTH domain
MFITMTARNEPSSVPHNNEFGEWLAAQIEERGWTHSQFAKRAHISRVTISDFVTGKRLPSLDTARRLAAALRMRDVDMARRIGLLDPSPPEVEDEDRLLRLFRALPAASRLMTLAMLEIFVEHVGAVHHMPEYDSSLAASLEELAALWATLGPAARRALLAEIRERGRR